MTPVPASLLDRRALTRSRARPDFPVAALVTWTEIGPGLRSDADFRIPAFITEFSYHDDALPYDPLIRRSP